VCLAICVLRIHSSATLERQNERRIHDIRARVKHENMSHRTGTAHRSGQQAHKASITHTAPKQLIVAAAAAAALTTHVLPNARGSGCTGLPTALAATLPHSHPAVIGAVPAGAPRQLGGGGGVAASEAAPAESLKTAGRGRRGHCSPS
jgi:hypothetical protein